MSLGLLQCAIGLVDEGESPEEAAIRELEEETGFKADKEGGVIESSPLLATDPGQPFNAIVVAAQSNSIHSYTGMTTANMKIVILKTTFPDRLELNDAKLDEGEHIVKRVVELERLYEILKGQLSRPERFRGFVS